MEISRFTDNKYKKWYMDIVTNARERQLPMYVEPHHVIPRILGGDDSTENMVSLTPREYFICHWLLTKFTTSQYLFFAVHLLRRVQYRFNENVPRYSTSITDRVFDRNDKIYSSLSVERLLETKPLGVKNKHSDETKAAAWERRKKNDLANRYEAVLTNVEMFEYLLDTIHPKQFSQYVKRRDKLWAEILEYTKHYENIKDVERMYLWYYRINPVCQVSGKKRPFNTFETGYKKFCGSTKACVCSTKHQSDFATIYWDNRTDEEKATIAAKRETTCMEKYGVSTPFKNKEIQDKFKATNMERYGVEYPFQSQEILDKATETIMDKYGVSAAGSIPEAAQKRKQTCLDKYGVDNTMHLARTALNKSKDD